MRRKAVFTGTFDPFTNGHLAIVERSLKLFDDVIIAVSYNEKKQTLFTVAERVQFIRQATQSLNNVTVVTHTGGLTSQLAKKLGACALIKGIRNANDLMYEQSMAHYNQLTDDTIETVFLCANTNDMFISSSGVKEYYRVGGDVSQMVTPVVANALKEKIVVEQVTYEH